MLGTQDTNRVPNFIEVFGRSQTVNLTKSRWFDIPLTREESLQADKKVSIVFGPSMDPGGVALVDNVQLYLKSKEAFGWPEDEETSAGTSSSAANNGSNSGSGHPGNGSGSAESNKEGSEGHSPVEKLVSSTGMLSKIYFDHAGLFIFSSFPSY